MKRTTFAAMLCLTGIVYCAEAYAVKKLDFLEDMVAAGMTLDFRPLEKGGILPYEPLAGFLVFRNDGAKLMKFRLPGFAGRVLKIIHKDGSEEVVLPERRKWRRSRRYRYYMLKPGEEMTEYLVNHKTYPGSLTKPGVYKVAFAFTSSVELQTPVFTLKVKKPRWTNRTVLRKMMRFQPDPEKSPISRRTIHLSKRKRSKEGGKEKGKAYIEQVADIVRKYP
ncbi:MAG: hypothetical protein GY862_24255, partial [Gammaproteobacteria bacterium]|nr:hypothetical protein [Gammaproteobacteria bacterium]